MTKKQKLELTWIGKEYRPKLEPRILLAEPEKSYHAKHRVTDHDIFDNQLIVGDNLLALKALEAEFTGKVKCVFIDPPYNTGSAFEHYDDGLAAIQSEFPSVTNFEREFPSLCFSLATGVGKTQLMGAFISYLFLACGIKNFFVLAPNLTIYSAVASCECAHSH